MNKILILICAAFLFSCGSKEKLTENKTQQNALLPDWNHKEYRGAPAVAGKKITVYRNESCGCCEGWMDHLKNHGFIIEDKIMQDVSPIKKKHGVTSELGSCHTAIVDGFVIEGHVPAQDIIYLLHSKPANIKGLTVPAMPVGTPGMEDPRTNRKDPFRVLAFDAKGEVSVYRTYENY